jgi:hypothetical protein
VFVREGEMRERGRERERERERKREMKERERKRERERETEKIAYLGGRSDASLATLELSGIQSLDRRRAIQLRSRHLLLHHTS